MKICLLGDAHAVHLQRLATGLSQRGHDVCVLCHKPAEIPGVTVEQFRVPRPSIVPANWVATLRPWRGRWDRYLRDIVRRFDVVNLHFLYDWGFSAEAIEEGCVVASPWGSDIVHPPGEELPSPALTESRKLLLHHAAAVTTCGPTFAGMVAEYAEFSTDRVDVVPFGVDLDLFRPVDGKRERRANALRVGFCKGFREVYQPVDVVTAIPHVLRRRPGTRFVLVGDGPQLSVCKALADRLNVDGSIEWVPRQPHREIPRILGELDLTVITSRHEAFGVAALESSAMGVPVVAYRTGGLVDTVRDCETGLLLSRTTSHDLAEAVTLLLADDSRRRAMGRAGRLWVRESFENRRVLQQWERLYSTALDRSCVMV